MTGDARGGFCDSWPALAPADGGADLLVVAVDLAQVTGEPGLLDAHERARADRLRTDDLQRIFIAAHTAVRRILGWYVERDPAELVYVTDEHGKPRLDGMAMHFNLSHSGAVALVAMGSAAPLGIDVERLDRLRDADHLAERMLAADELVAFRALPTLQRSAHLLHTWTRKEAVLKALGVGLPGGMEAVVIAVAPLRLVGDLHRFPHLTDLRLDDLPVSAGYAGALCQARPHRQPTLRRWCDAHALG